MYQTNSIFFLKKYSFKRLHFVKDVPLHQSKIHTEAKKIRPRRVFNLFLGNTISKKTFHIYFPIFLKPPATNHKWDGQQPNSLSTDHWIGSEIKVIPTLPTRRNEPNKHPWEKHLRRTLKWGGCHLTIVESKPENHVHSLVIACSWLVSSNAFLLQFQKSHAFLSGLNL